MEIKENKIRKEGGIVVLPVEEYQRLLAKAVPTYYLKGKEAESLDSSIREAEEEYKSGETKEINSLEDLS